MVLCATAGQLVGWRDWAPFPSEDGATGAGFTGDAGFTTVSRRVSSGLTPPPARGRRVSCSTWGHQAAPGPWQDSPRPRHPTGLGAQPPWAWTDEVGSQPSAWGAGVEQETPPRLSGAGPAHPLSDPCLPTDTGAGASGWCPSGMFPPPATEKRFAVHSYLKYMYIKSPLDF